MTVGIVDYGIGNVGSIRNMLRKAGIAAALVASPEEIAAADRLILPGIGAFDDVMRAFDASGLRPAVEARARGDGRPLLGVCVGMQMLMEGSDEGDAPGLGWLKGRARSLRTRLEGTGLRVPHMGWNTIDPSGASPLLARHEPRWKFYFAHAYAVECDDPADIVATTTHGVAFASIVGRGNIHGVQFHPEKSREFGLALLRGFAEAA
ncbi:MAG: imidazole glycerol phosphate synthase subunit HisH [Rhodospirillales bacterium]|nr:MAG: imidazole glycerol phosphate synthase subunit HisH [Rhodospirillales bacterium]